MARKTEKRNPQYAATHSTISRKVKATVVGFTWTTCR